MNTNAFIEALFDRARAAGFEACEAYVSESDSFHVSVHRGELSRYSVSDSLNLGFRALKGGRIGCASTQVLDESAVQMLVDAAREGAELCEGEGEESIFEGSAAYPELDGARPAIARMSAAEKIAMARALEEETLRQDARIESVEECALASVSSRRRLVNSRGLDRTYHVDFMRACVYPIARANGKTGTAGRAQYAADPAQIDLAGMAREAAEEAVADLDARSVVSGTYPILLRPDAAADLLAAFASLFSADAAQKGLSLLKGREGNAIAAPCVSIADDPLLAEGFASRPFDGEGVASQRVNVVEGGVLRTLMHNLKTARRQGMETTASAARVSCAGPMTVAPSNFFIRAGADAPEALYARAGRALLITDLMGLHSGCSAVSGDFSLGAKGFLVENGRIQRAVNQITIAGNFLDLLKEIEAVGSDLRHDRGSIASPTLLLRSLSVAGAGD